MLPFSILLHLYLQTYPLRRHNLGDLVVLVHGPHPLADGGTGLGDFGDGCRSEVLVVNVRLDLGDHSVWDVLLHVSIGSTGKSSTEDTMNSVITKGTHAINSVIHVLHTLRMHYSIAP